MGAVRSPAKLPHFYHRFAGEITSGLLYGLIQVGVGWLPGSGLPGPDGCGRFAVCLKDALIYMYMRLINIQILVRYM